MTHPVSIVLQNEGIQVVLTNVGAAMMSLRVFDTDVVLGYQTMEAYLENPNCFGATVGRIANRVSGARFRLDGRTYTLAANNGTNHIHGGVTGLTRRVFDVADHDSSHVQFRYHSPDGEEGYPGNLDICVEYALVGRNGIAAMISAASDRLTYFAPTNHTYFNLNGEFSGVVNQHLLCINAERYTETGPGLIPTGRLLPVEGTPYDFRTPRPIGDAHFDLNYELTDASEAWARGDRSGITMQVKMDMPGVQFFVPKDPFGAGRTGAEYCARGAFCLEPQFFPDSVNRCEFKKPLVAPDRPFKTEIQYLFSR